MKKCVACKFQNVLDEYEKHPTSNQSKINVLNVVRQVAFVIQGWEVDSDALKELQRIADCPIHEDGQILGKLWAKAQGLREALSVTRVPTRSVNDIMAMSRYLLELRRTR